MPSGGPRFCVSGGDTPYSGNRDLPAAVKNALPDTAQTVWRSAFNSAAKQYGDEQTAFKVAWAAVKRGWKQVDGNWVKKAAGLFWRDSGGDEYELSKVAVAEAPIDDITQTFEITKTDDAKQMVFGWASVAKDRDGNLIEDRQGDVIDATDLEDAAYLFTLNFREGDEMHTDEVKMHLVESFVVTPEKLQKMGLPEGSLPTGWWTGFHIPDREFYEKARDSYPMFSIAGVAIAEEV